MKEKFGQLNARTLTASAVMTALLIAVQFAFGFVSGVELVTVFLLSFCYAFGALAGVLTALSFSLLRCFLYGFYPNVLLLYLLYYPIFALCFGLMGSKSKPLPVWVCPLLLTGLAAFCGYFAAAGVKVSVLYQTKISVMLWVLFAILCALSALYFIVLLKGGKREREGREVASVTALAAFFTVCFTLADDVISPLWYGYSAQAAIAYFYTGFLAMIPQTVCTAVSVFLLFFPLKKVFFSAAKRELVF